MQHTPSVMVESYHTEHTKQSHSNTKSHASHDQETWKLQQEINRLCSKNIKEEAPLPYQVMVLEAGTVGTIVDLELHLVNRIQFLRIRTSGRRAVMIMRKGLPAMAWGMMQ